METTNHTPGPWTVRGDTIVAGTEYTCWQIAVIIPELPNQQELGNARLIAAAPDLLAALEAMLEAFIVYRFGDYDLGVGEAEAAIAKAKGGG